MHDRLPAEMPVELRPSRTWKFVCTNRFYFLRGFPGRICPNSSNSCFSLKRVRGIYFCRRSLRAILKFLGAIVKFRFVAPLQCRPISILNLTIKGSVHFFLLAINSFHLSQSHWVRRVRCVSNGDCSANGRHRPA